ncbi:putative metallopeptidase family m24 protein [Erysiphe necator]|uniref:Putative metallopeptidase family m24 protein n=1 Tax=Uncinula necator TaxID=52586 RepID=A0A0B1P6V9_UNCNE|nr:putative metallopeptidase family m24 protein [Erysiphe necator]
MEPGVALRSWPSSYSFNKNDGFSLNPVTALKLLCAGVEALVKLSESITPVSNLMCNNISNTPALQSEKKVTARDTLHDKGTEINNQQTHLSFDQDNDGTPKETPYNIINGLPSTEPYIVIGENTETSNAQRSAIIRKFYSKSLPHINLVDYLMRIHKFCPMSTAIYLATSSYIHKLASEEKTISVTRRNCHRLVLAGLRVTMKAFEDQAYSHSRFSKVGGVTPGELARLEINFCFLVNFDLVISGEVLLKHAMDLKAISSLQGGVNFNPGILSKSQGRSSLVAKEVTADA